MQILGTGLTGLLGNRITKVLSDFEFTSLSRSNGADVTDKNSLEPHFAEFPGVWVLHMAAKADVDGCEKDKDLRDAGEAWRINVLGTRNISELTKKYNKKLIYISTDFVFDGEKKEGEGYVEEDAANPINWYGATKFYGEKEIIKSGCENAILRIAYPYGESNAPKRDFARIIAERLKNNLPIKGITDHTFVPTYIDDVAFAIKAVIEQEQLVLFHAVGGSPLSPYDAAVCIAKAVGVDPGVIGKTTLEEYFALKAKRPRNLYLKNDKIETLGVRMRSFEEGIKDMF